MKSALFVCSANKLRSPTAETVFSSWPNIEVESAGLNHDADVPLSPERLVDRIFVMEKAHRSKLSRRYRKYLKGKRVICLDIPDNYKFMDPVLVKRLEAKAGPFLR